MKGPRFWALLVAFGLTVLVTQTFLVVALGWPIDAPQVCLGAIAAVAGVVVRKRERKTEQASGSVAE